MLRAGANLGLQPTVYYFCVVTAIPPSSKSGLAKGGFYFLFMQKNVGNTRKKEATHLGVSCFKHDDASVFLGPDAAWCRLN